MRAEIGYRFTPAWDAAFAYTYLRADGGQSLQAGTEQLLFPTLTRPGLTDAVTSATASAALAYNLYDLQVGRRFAVDEHFGVRVFGGFRFASISQDLNAFYDGLDARQASVTTKSQFAGFGPLIGGDAVLVGWCGFHLYARASGGLLTGSSTNTLLETNDAGGTVYADVRYNIRKVVPVGTIGIGGGWQYRTVSVRFGYEITQWFGLTERVRLVDDISQGKFVSRRGTCPWKGCSCRSGSCSNKCRVVAR